MSTATTPGAQTLAIPLDNVIANPAFNARFAVDTESEGDEDTHEFSGLKNSIKEKGQITPVTVRRDKKHPDKFNLIAGFRRHLAISQLAQEQRVEKPTIQAIIADVDDLDAYEINALENLAREDLSAPDTAVAVANIRDAAKSKYGDKEQSVRKIAARVGLSFGYVGKLLKIKDDLVPEIFLAWRTAKVKKDVNTMVEIAKLPKGKQAAAYKGEQEDGEEDTGKEREKKLKGAVRTAKIVGAALGRLARESFLNCKGLVFAEWNGKKWALPDEDRPAVYALIDLDEKALTKSQWAQVGGAAEEAYKVALTGEEEIEDEGEAAE